jgi:hypothetical protein
MPGANPIIASGAIVAISVAAAAAIALYENPELRRYADDLRRRIAMAFYSVGDGINPPDREPLFNRPEDAHGFLQSRRGEGAEPGVDADDETRRKQREELLYWNSIRLLKEAENAAAAEKAALEQGEKAADPADRPGPRHRGSSFDDFLQPDEGAEKGTFVYNSGADIRAENGGLRHRGDGARSFASLYANPFADEHHIDTDEMDRIGESQIAPGQDEVLSDIYSATTVERPLSQPIAQPVATAESLPSLIEFDAVSTPTETSATVDHEPEQEQYMTAGQENREEAYASIQAWAQTSGPGFYSPLPSTPAQPVSEPELLSDGQLTPTDSASLVGSGEDIANDVRSLQEGEAGRAYDVMSQSSGMMTPASWSEVGSVVSESDTPVAMRS